MTAPEIRALGRRGVSSRFDPAAHQRPRPVTPSMHPEAAAQQVFQRGFAGARSIRAGIIPAPFEAPRSRSVRKLVIIGDSSWEMKAAALFRVGEATAHNLKGFVDAAIERANGGTIEDLVILDHALPGFLLLGTDEVTLYSLDEHREQLLRLRQVLGPNSRVHLAGCMLAASPNGRALVQKLANLLGVPVTANENVQWVLVPGTEGDSITCYPETTGRAPTVQSHPLGFLWRGLQRALVALGRVPADGEFP